MKAKNSFFKSFVMAVAFLGVLGMFQASKVEAYALTVGGGWADFSFGNEGSSWSDEFSFELLMPGVLVVTDAFMAGDRFEVFNHGSSLGLTSVAAAFEDWIGNYDDAAADSRWSTGFWNLPAGSYLISGLVTASPFGSGGGAIRVDPAPVPEPGTLVLLGGALVGLFGLRRTRKA